MRRNVGRGGYCDAANHFALWRRDFDRKRATKILRAVIDRPAAIVVIDNPNLREARNVADVPDILTPQNQQAAVCRENNLTVLKITKENRIRGLIVHD
jgi:hypothetical protein